MSSNTTTVRSAGPISLIAALLGAIAALFIAWLVSDSAAAADDATVGLSGGVAVGTLGAAKCGPAEDGLDADVTASGTASASSDGNGSGDGSGSSDSGSGNGSSDETGNGSGGGTGDGSDGSGWTLTLINVDGALNIDDLLDNWSDRNLVDATVVADVDDATRTVANDDVADAGVGVVIGDAAKDSGALIELDLAGILGSRD